MEAYAASLYPVYAGEVWRTEELIAIPISAYGIGQWGYNSALGEALGVRKPQTLQELAALYLAWEKLAGDQEELRLTLQDGFEEKRLLLQRGLIDYAAAWPKGTPLSYDTPAFHQLLRALDQAAPLFEARTAAVPLDREYTGEEVQALRERSLLTNYYSLLTGIRESRGVFELLPLGIIPEQGAVVTVGIAVLAVNPYSPY